MDRSCMFIDVIKFIYSIYRVTYNNAKITAITLNYQAVEKNKLVAMLKINLKETIYDSFFLDF